MGPKDARVTLVEFSDFQCPYCAIAVVKLNAILKAYPNDVKLIFKQFPLDTHSQAALAAAAALAAHRQGKFWQLHDAMYADRTHLSRQNILAMAGTVGLDVKRFQQDWDSPAIKQAVSREQAEGEKIGVDATPRSLSTARGTTASSLSTPSAPSSKKKSSANSRLRHFSAPRYPALSRHSV